MTLQKKQAEFALASLREAGTRGAIYAPSAMHTDQVISGIAGRLVELAAQKRALLSEQTESHPAVRTVQEQIDELQRKLQATYDTAYRTAERQEGVLNRRIRSLEGELRNLPATERDLARLERVTKVTADIYTMLLNKHEEARVARAATISNISVVDPAIVATRPVRPQKIKNVILGLLVGCIVGIGLSFFREYMDDTVKDPEQAKRLLGLPLLALIPFLGKNGNGKTGNGENGKSISICTHSDPRSTGAEAFRTLRTALHFSSLNRERKVLLITSAFPGEGKSTISANLGIVFSQTGARVLVVDCDLRRPSLHTKFGHAQSPGLTEIITGDSDVDSVVCSTGIPGLNFISSGVIPPNPAELLGAEEMRRLVEQLRERYDHVILDAPPVLAVTDTPVLSTLADHILVVMQSERVPTKALARMRDILQSTGVRIAGFVFNDQTNCGERYGYYGYYKYGYGYGYAQENPKKKKWGWSGSGA